MKGRGILLSGLLVACWSSAVLAHEAWLMVHGADHRTIMRTAGKRLVKVAELGDLTSYGQSAQAMAFLSRSPSTDKFALTVVDKKTQQVTVTRPVAGFVATQLAGGVEDLVVTDEFLYFVTLRLNGAHQIEPNELGGQFDFNAMRLADGNVRSFPLPKECQNPRLANFAGTPVVYSWNDYEVWKFDAAAGQVKRVLARRDITEVVVGEQQAQQSGKIKSGVFADDVVVPGEGVFRASRLGRLDRILDANLQPVGPPSPSADLSMDAPLIHLFGGTFKGKPAIGVVGRQGGNVTLEYLSPGSLSVEWKTDLSSNIVPLSIYAGPGDAVSYVDKNTATIEKTSPTGTTILWDLKELGPQLEPSRITILRVTGSD